MRFRSDAIAGLLVNTSDIVGKTIRSIPIDEKVTLSVGCGVKDSGIPLRFLAYIIPALHLLKQLTQQTKLEVYLALEGVLRVNGMDEAKTRANANKMARLVIEYVKTFHPKVAGQVDVLFDRKIEFGSKLDQQIDGLTTELSRLTSSVEPIQKFVEARNGAQSLRYMAEHTLYMRDPLCCLLPLEDNLLVPMASTGMVHVIMVGGPAEKVFHKARTALMGQLPTHDRWKSNQFFTQIGSPPSYHPQDGESLYGDELPSNVADLFDSILKNVSTNRGVQKGVMRDMLVLLIDSGAGNTFQQVGRLSGTLRRGGKIDTEIAHLLQDGWNRLRTL
ncbi:MAG: hypothetical protein HOE80_02325 [Candidatus Magasanikbacteria bacterium]|jgi:hypothetical protein|nr:hypothetical protein [Candidatus Magasanikbacteria bacterium]MBT4071536.1 hypothetical protein [Candidatus Magasanikbacteria bacterium]